VTLYDGGVLVGTATATGGNWSYAVITFFDTSHTYTATATDAATNVSSASSSVTVTADTVAPNAPVITSLPLTTNNQTPAITGTAEANSTVKVYYAGSTLIGTVTANGSGAWTLTPGSNLAAATYTITAAATDAAGNVSTASAGGSLIIDITAPTISGGVTSSTADASYKTAQTISIQVGFSEAVTVTGTPTLLLATGSTNQSATYTSGSGTATLTFTYTVVSGDTAADLDYVATSSLSTAGGTIRDSVGNTATLTLAAPGAAGSLGANKNIVIDTTAPAAPVITSPANNASLPTRNFTVSGTAEANSTVTLYDGGVLVGTATATVATGLTRS